MSKECQACDGTGSVRIETAPGEWRTNTCGACLGKGTAWAVQLHDEFKRGWNAAMKAIESNIRAMRR